MALRVWLPLNGNLNNQGLSNLVFNSSGSPVIQAGKIGNNYYLFPIHADVLKVRSL